jgi:HlyD family secretion protein
MGEANRRIIDVDNVKPLRSTAQKRQIAIAAAAVVLVAGLGVGAYFLISPKPAGYTLRGYQSAKVELGTLVQSTQASGTVALPVQMSLPSPEEGYSAELRVAEGDKVVKGQVLARIDVPTLSESLEDLQASLQDAKRTYQKTVESDRVALERKQREIDSLRTDIADARAERDRVQKLVDIKASTQNDLDTAQKSVDKLVAGGKEKSLQLEEDRKLYAMDEQSSVAAIDDLTTKIKRLNERIRATTITSPMNGEVLAILDALAVPGSLITANQTLFTIADPSSAIVELEVSEQYSGLLSEKQEVELTVGSTTLTGKITGIGKVAEQSSDGLGATVAVKVKPVGDASSLILGNTAVGVIDLGAKTNALLLARGPYLTTGSQRYLYKVQGTTAERIAVTFGSTDGSTVEILTGVQAGDEIVTSGYQNFVEFEKINLVTVKGDKT